MYKYRLFSNKASSNLCLDPYFVTGLTEAEGSFSVIKHKDIRALYKVNISLRFKITMLDNEFELLNMVKSFFNCGFITSNKDGSVDYVVRDIESIKSIIIPHFTKYPLRGTKYLDFLSFKKAVSIMLDKEHLTQGGINKISDIIDSMNTYRDFSNIIHYSPAHAQENNKKYIPLNGNYVNGFIAGDGCLALNLNDQNFGRMTLQISQHINNKSLIISIANYFKSPSKVYPHSAKSVQLTLS
jgi:hypothetical protein